MDIQLGDILIMRKSHPCGSSEFDVLRTGADIKIKCRGCGHEIMVPRVKIEKNVKNIKRTAK